MYNQRSLIRILCALAILVPATQALSIDSLILQVPDWDQPSAYGVAGYPSWCSPTAAANVMGYWEDVMGCTGLTDRALFPATPAYPATAGTWQQGLWHDGTIEMGWHMDTGTWQSSPLGFPPNAGTTATANIGPGMLAYASSGYVDPTAITKVAYPNTSVGIDTVLGAAMWTQYMAEIDAGRPSVVSWLTWVDSTAPGNTHDINGQTVTEYPWTVTDPHSVCGVGYIEPTPGLFNGDEFIIAQDNWQTTGQYVAVPVDSNWVQNDYVYDVPEPATLALLAIGGLFVLVGKRS